MNCKINKPYPEIKVENKNIMYASLLLKDYTGRVSELTSITQYVYQSFDKFDINPIFSSTLSQIAMVEMKHLELLGKTIKLLGLNPQFKIINNFPVSYWQSKYINYSSDLKEMLKDDIKIEKEAIKNYQKDIDIINDKNIKKLLYRIIEDEKKHIECFYMLLNKVN